MLSIEMIKGDITQLTVDAIANATNSSLLGGGGVDGAIHRAGGAAILEECKAIRARHGGCPTGEAVITTAGRLPAKKVIHTVGPVWQDGQHHEPEQLRSCYRNALRLAEKHNLKTIAFPNISTGIYRFPKELAAELAITEVRNYTSEVIEKVIFVCFDEENYRIYEGLLGE